MMYTLLGGPGQGAGASGVHEKIKVDKLLAKAGGLGRNRSEQSFAKPSAPSKSHANLLHKT